MTTTTRTRAIVSRAAALTLALAVTACARNPSPVTREGTVAIPERLLTVRFDNEAQVSVHVYLVSEQREWLLGGVAPGARATLRLPVAALEETVGFVRLVVLAGGPMAVVVARDPRATYTISQPASSILKQRWTFSQRQLSPPEIFGAPPELRRPGHM